MRERSSSHNAQRLVKQRRETYHAIRQAYVVFGQRRHWGELVQSYFEGRESLCGLLLIVDVRRLLTDFDRQMLQFAGSVDLRVHVLLTKADKLKRGKAANAFLSVRKELAESASVNHR